MQSGEPSEDRDHQGGVLFRVLCRSSVDVCRLSEAAAEVPPRLQLRCRPAGIARELSCCGRNAGDRRIDLGSGKRVLKRAAQV